MFLSVERHSFHHTRVITHPSAMRSSACAWLLRDPIDA
jgi:hypothetical protein